MRVRLWRPVLPHVPMHIHVRDQAALHELLFDKLAGELDALLLVQLARNRELHLARQLRVLAFLRSEEHTSELQSLMSILYAVLGLKKKINTQLNPYTQH